MLLLWITEGSVNSLRFISIDSVMLLNHQILCHPLLVLCSMIPSIRAFSMSWLITAGGQSPRASASVSVLLMNIQCWFPIGLIGLISLLSKGLSRVFFNTAVLKHQSILLSSAFFVVQLSHPYKTTGKNYAFDYMDVCQQTDVSVFYYAV